MMQKLADNVYVALDYEGVNVGAVVTDHGPIAIDAPSYPRDARDWAMRLHSVSPYPTQALLLTDGHGDRLLNARWLNAPLIVHTDTAEKINSFDKKYPHTFLESLMIRNPDKGRDLHSSPIERPSLSFSHDFSVYKGRQHIEAMAVAGPNTGCVWVYIPQSGILFVGDSLVVETHPIVNGGSVAAWLDALETLRHWPRPLSAIVPGRGPVCTPDDVQPVVDYLQAMLVRVREHVENGRSRDDTAIYLPEFLARFPTHHLPIDWLKRQIKVSLAHVYDEIKLPQAPYTEDSATENQTDHDETAVDDN